MCIHNIISGIITWFYVYTKHHLWNHNLILCVHITSSLESQPDFMCKHNIISGIITWFYVYTKKIISGISSWFLINVAKSRDFLKAWAERARKAIKQAWRSQRSDHSSRGAKCPFCCLITLLIWRNAYSKV